MLKLSPPGVSGLPQMFRRNIVRKNDGGWQRKEGRGGKGEQFNLRERRTELYPEIRRSAAVQELEAFT